MVASSRRQTVKNDPQMIGKVAPSDNLNIYILSKQDTTGAKKVHLYEYILFIASITG